MFQDPLLILFPYSSSFVQKFHAVVDQLLDALYVYFKVTEGKDLGSIHDVQFNQLLRDAAIEFEQLGLSLIANPPKTIP